jgi:hypothetical protein
MVWFNKIPKMFPRYFGPKRVKISFLDGKKNYGPHFSDYHSNWILGFQMMHCLFFFKKKQLVRPFNLKKLQAHAQALSMMSLTLIFFFFKKQN